MINKNAKKIALCGVFASLAIVIMCLGGLIPIATYISPILLMLIGCVIMKLVGVKLAWTWYVVVSILSLLLSADKESACMYLALGYYPYLKQWFERSKLHYILKFIYFNCAIASVYGILLYLIGLQQLIQDFEGIGFLGLSVILLMGNAVFFMLDRILTFTIQRFIK